MGAISSSANCLAKPAVACSKILSEQGLKAWWIGKVIILELDPQWPAQGSKMSWKAGGGIFKAKVTIDNRPSYLEMEVDTPGADSIIKNSFDELPTGETRYTKIVEPKWRSGFAKFMSPLLMPIIKASVKAEVKRAAKFADS